MIWPFQRRVRHANKIDITPPTAAPNRDGICLVIIVKNEAHRIKDWLTFHALAGVRDVILYDNLSTDDTVKIAQSFEKCRVTIVPWAMQTRLDRRALLLPQQVLAYAHALCTFGGQYRWMAMIDADEYLVPVQHKTLNDALGTLDTYSNISLPWVMFGHCGHETAPTDAAPFAYQSRARAMDGNLLNFKCILDPCRVTQVSVHKFHTDDMGANSANTRGQTRRNKQRASHGFVTTDLLQLNHYYLGSRQEMETKINGTAVSGVKPDQRGRSVRAKATRIEAASILDTSAPAFLARHGVQTSDALRDVTIAEPNS